MLETVCDTPSDGRANTGHAEGLTPLKRLVAFRSVAGGELCGWSMQTKPGRPDRWLPDNSMAMPAGDCGCEISNRVRINTAACNRIIDAHSRLAVIGSGSGWPGSDDRVSGRRVGVRAVSSRLTKRRAHSCVGGMCRHDSSQSDQAVAVSREFGAGEPGAAAQSGRTAAADAPEEADKRRRLEQQHAGGLRAPRHGRLPRICQADKAARARRPAAPGTGQPECHHTKYAKEPTWIFLPPSSSSWAESWSPGGRRWRCRSGRIGRRR